MSGMRLPELGVKPNLLSAISAGRLQLSLPDADYKLLLSNVRDNRDTKFQDFFFDTLEKILNELKSTTDNNDAAAFQKPVSRQEAPDYHNIIAHPMDLATMSKKVKQRSYKNKKDFADDLNLIWDNCLKYNTGKDHYLRGCANRMRAKANKLLERISDRNERNNPAQVVNGVPAPPPKANGIKLVLKKAPSIAKTAAPSPAARSTMTPPARSTPAATAGKVPKRTVVSFADRSAIERTSDAMTLFRELDGELDRYMKSMRRRGAAPATAPVPASSLAEKMRAVIEADELFMRSGIVEKAEEENGPDEDAVEPSPAPSVPPAPQARSARDELMAFMNEMEEGKSLKRKRSQSASADDSRKRPKLEELDAVMPEPLPTDPVDLWWELMRTDTMLGGGLPPIPAMPTPRKRILKKKKLSAQAKATKVAGKRPVAKKKKASQSLLHLMNKNIKTLKRIQRIHDKFSILKEAMSAEPGAAPPPPAPPAEVEDEAIYRPWKRRAPEIDAAQAEDCMKWMSTKVLQHEGFGGSSSVALDVLTSVAGEFLSNVGRTLRFYCDKYSHSMTGEEILLHTLFESGTTQVSDLEKYVKDDIVRYGGRLGELERKLENAYREVTAVATDEMGEFDEESEDLVFGNFPTELDGEDFFGFKAMGLDKELGLASLSVPMRLWNAKKRMQTAADTTGPSEPQLPYPPPPAFVPLESAKIGNQIGLLQAFYVDKARAAAPPPPPPPPLPINMLPPPPPPVPVYPLHPPPPPPVPVQPQLSNGFSLPSTSEIPFNLNPAAYVHPIPMPMHMPMPMPMPAFTLPPAPMQAPPAEPPPMAAVIPDDVPDAEHSKLGPLGQILQAGTAGGGSKKKKDSGEKKAKPPPNPDKDKEKEKKEPAPKGRPKKKKDSTAGELPPPLAGIPPPPFQGPGALMVG
ncbi:hypothetical protein AURDEDRAFT_187007 [Auricularia subglabra TFB-10046 SS5]|nr:hypothetical protein AURDEDRAFT_187007 [Auricularia subglabra TFB-10046 SS5]